MKLFFTFFASVTVCCQCTIGYAATKAATLVVPGMTCAACPITVKKALSRVDGVSAVSVSYEKMEVTVTFDDARTTLGALMQATTNAGYPSMVRKSHE